MNDAFKMSPAALRQLADDKEKQAKMDAMKGTYLGKLAEAIGTDKLIQVEFLKFNTLSHNDARHSNGTAEKAQQGKFVAWEIHGNTAIPRKLAFASFVLNAMPGCCGIVVSTGSFVDNSFRGKGIGTILNDMRKEIAHLWGYSLMLCTDVEKNIPQQKILAKNGWEKLKSFRNTRSDNDVCIHSVDVSKSTGTKLGFELYGEW